MPDERVQFIFAAKNLVSKEAKAVKRDVAAVEKQAHKAGGGLGGLAAGLRSVISPAALVAGGATAVAAGLAAAAGAAIDEERNIARLDAALEANVAGWDGNREAIERVIAERERLAFADDDLRASLALLVSTTKDEQKALELQAVAMDLARLRGIGLADASLLIGKVYAGNIGILSRYGIQVKKGTTATQALAEIQRRAAGQAKKYGDTAGAIWESVGIVFGDVVEDIGMELLPGLKAVGTTLRDDVIPFVSDAIELFGDLAGVVGDVAATVQDNPIVDFATQREAHEFWDQYSKDLRAAEEAHETFMASAAGLPPAIRGTAEAADGLGDSLGDLTSSTEELSESEEDLFARTNAANRSMERHKAKLEAASDAADELKSSVGLLTEGLFGQTIAAGELAEAQAGLAALLAEGPETKKARDVAIWRGEVAQQRAEIIELEAAIAQAAGSDAFAAWLAKTKAGINQNDTALLRLIARIEALAKAAGILPAPTKGGWTIRLQAMAKGGFLGPGEVAVVGEKGPELAVGRVGGAEIVPVSGGAPMSGSPGGVSGGGSLGGAPVVIQVALDSRVIATVVDEQLYYRRAAAPR